MRTTNILIICFLIFAFNGVNAQKINESKVPQDVVISFRYKYPDATINYWEKNSDNYVASFKMNDQSCNAEFDANGAWIESRFQVKEKELPTPISDYYKENYLKLEYNMSLIEIHKTSQGKSYYYLMLKIDGATQLRPVELTFDLAGSLLTKSDPGQAIANEERKNDPNQNGGDNNDAKQPTEDDSKYLTETSQVPATAKSHFTSKNKKATGAAWYFKDNKYIVKFMVESKKGQCTYSKEGTWAETRMETTEDKLNQLILTYLKDNYRQYKIKSVESVIQTKDKLIYIRMYDKRSRAVPPPITEIWFTTSGKFVSVNKPEITEPGQAEDQKKRDNKDKEFMAEVDKNGGIYEEANNYNDKISQKELPSTVISYIKTNYKELNITSTRLVTDDELGNVYRVVVKKEGVRYGTILLFDLAGNFKKKIEENESQMSNDDIDAGGDNETVLKYGTADEKISTADLPSEISKYLKKNYPDQKILEQYFKTDKDMGNCFLLIMNKAGEKKITKLYFDLDGNLLKSQSENL